MARQFLSSGLLRGAATLMTGTALAHGITIAATPVLTRLYGPAEFGVFAVFLAMVNLTSVAACLRFEMAIPLAEEDRDSIRLLGLAIGSTTVTVGISLALVALFRNEAARLLDMPALAWLLWLAPAAVLIRGIFQSLNYLATRRERLRRIASARVGQSATATLVQIGAGATGLWGVLGLAGGQIAGTAVAAGILAHRFRADIFQALSSIWRWRELLPVALRFKSFPLLDVPASLLNTGAYELPALLLGMFFAEAMVGQFSLAMRVVALPSVFISASLAQVFYRKAAKAYVESGNTRQVTIPSLRALLYLALPGYLALAIIANSAFVPIFGPGWGEAGIYAAALCPLCFFMFLVAPISQHFFVFGKQKALLKFQLLYCAISATAFTAGRLSGSPLLGIVLFSGLGSVRYLMMLVFICRLDKISPREVLFGAQSTL